MFSLLGKSTKLCDRISRREMLRIGGLSTLGLSLPQILRASTEAPPPGIINDPTFGRAKNIIYVWLQGGPPQHETFDPKPEAPLEIRGPFSPIRTNVPGIDFCELLPRTARIADKLAIVRSLSTDNNLHCASGYEVLTGYRYQGANSRVIAPTDWPWFGSLIKMLKPSEKLPPLSTVWIPQIMRLNENVTPAGQTAGFLGRIWDPDRFEGDPSHPDYKVEGLQLDDVPPLRLSRRHSLLEQVERHFAHLERGRPAGVYDRFQEQAFDILTSGRVQKAFKIQDEPQHVRDRYGKTQWSQCLLLARRLIEVGARLVHVGWPREPGDSAVDNPLWDTHAQNADRMEDVLAPIFDGGFTALIDDLDQRGLLDETLVVAIGEFGRTPKINSQGGRDHWGPVFSFALAGAGVRTAQVYGASDRDGAYPAKDRVSGADLTATIFHLIGIHHETKFTDPEHREHRVTMGQPIRQLLGDAPATDARIDAGGSIARVPPYDDSLLLNVDFSTDVPLQATNLGSRPKGWRATPLVTDEQPNAFGVRLVPNPHLVPHLVPKLPLGNAAARQTCAIGFGIAHANSPLRIAAGTNAILAQEMRNPRLGTFVFSVDACGHAPSKELYDDFLKNFTCRLVIYRYKDMHKDPANRQDFIALDFQPPYSPQSPPAATGGTTPPCATFEVSKHLDSPGPGQNFPIGNGYGVAVIVEKTSPGTLELPAAAAQAFIRIHRATLNFKSRTVNPDVKV